MKFRYILPLLLALPLLAGCVFESYRPVTEYDLSTTKVELKPGASLRVLEFRNDSSAGNRFLYRETSGRIEKDPYNSWVLPPGELLSRALNLTLGTPGMTAGAIPITGTLEVFETERSSDAFRLAGTFRRSGEEKIFRFDYSVPLNSRMAGSIAAAASECVRKLAEEIAGADFSRE